MNKAIFLDRDGIINETYVVAGKSYPPSCVEALQLVKGIKELLTLLSKEYLLIGITNQPDISRGLQNWCEVERINNYIKNKLPILEFFVCPHSDEDNCTCRKPKVGLFIQAVEKYDIDLSQSFCVGDRWKDVEAGINAGCKTIWVDYGYIEKKPLNADYVVQSVKDILELNIF